MAAYLRYLAFLVKLIASLKGTGVSSADFWSILANNNSDSEFVFFS